MEIKLEVGVVALGYLDRSPDPIRFYSLFNLSSNTCAIDAHMPRSRELGTSCPPFHEYVVRFLASTSPMAKATK